MIEINPGDLNLQTLAGNATDLVDGSDLPNLLYVFGAREGSEYDYYLDPLIPNVEALAVFLKEHGFRLTVSMPLSPAKRPAVAISRDVRANDIEAATRLCVLVLLHLNGRLNV